MGARRPAGPRAECEIEKYPRRSRLTVLSRSRASGLHPSGGSQADGVMRDPGGGMRDVIGCRTLPPLTCRTLSERRAVSATAAFISIRNRRRSDKAPPPDSGQAVRRYREIQLLEMGVFIKAASSGAAANVSSRNRPNRSEPLMMPMAIRAADFDGVKKRIERVEGGGREPVDLFLILDPRPGPDMSIFVEPLEHF